jgi:hypothetical protein
MRGCSRDEGGAPATNQGTPAGDHEKGQPGTLRVLVALAGPAFIAIIVYAAAEGSWSVFALSMLIAACAFSLGALLGFLFGIPQYFAKGGDPSAAAKASYQPNTNLTQVSDWLTKIIIGVGLVQFGQLTHTIGDLGDELASSLGGDPTGQPFAIALVVGFFVIGFLVGYLYTRLRLQGAFTLSDRGAFDAVEEVVDAKVDAKLDAKLEEQKKADAQALELTKRQLDPAAKPPTPEELKAAISDASPAAKAQAMSQALGPDQPTAEPTTERAKVVIEAIEEPDEGS